MAPRAVEWPDLGWIHHWSHPADCTRVKVRCSDSPKRRQSRTTAIVAAIWQGQRWRATNVAWAQPNCYVVIHGVDLCTAKYGCNVKVVYTSTSVGLQIGYTQSTVVPCVVLYSYSVHVQYTDYAQYISCMKLYEYPGSCVVC